MEKVNIRLFVTVICCFLLTLQVAAQSTITPQPLKVGYAVVFTDLTPEKMAYAKSVGIDYLEVSLGSVIDKDRNFKQKEEEILAKIKAGKKAADEAGIKIWSIHMPYGPKIDLSMADEQERQQVVALHRKVLELISPLKPEVILFHPSYYLGLNERELRTKQMVKSAVELNNMVRAMNATMVIENMLGFELLRDTLRERPLCRTVEETVAIMSLLPENIYAAVDMNHIKYPEKLIRALGKRLQSVHIADGTGREENHYFPCSGQGENNWIEILAALNEVGYTGPFLFESKFNDVKELSACYQSLYKSFIAQKFN